MQDLHELRIPVAGIGAPAAWSPEGGLLAAAVNTDQDIGSVKIIRIRDLTPIRTLVPGEGRIEQVGFSPDGRLLAASYIGSGSGVAVWQTADWKLLKTFSAGKSYGGFAFSQDGALLAVAGNDLRLLDGRTLTRIGALNGYSLRGGSSRGYRHMQFSPDSTFLACDYAPDSGPDSGHPKVRLWRVAGKDPIGTLDGGHALSVPPFVFLPGSRLLVMEEGRSRSTFNCWGFPGGKLLYGTSWGNAPQRYLDASYDGCLIAIGPAILGD